MTFQLGDYRAIELIGSGGSARVWRGVRISSGAAIAIKVFPPDELAGARREAALAAVVNHPHVVAVVDVVGDTERAALVTEFAAGGDLNDLLTRRGRLSAGQTLTVLLPLAAALATAHEREIVHGDLSAPNILFDLAGRPLLADLGAGRAAAEMGMPVSATPVDAAPELARGGPPTPASDMFSLGSLALACLTGRHAWPAEDLRDVLIQAAAGQWPDPGDDCGPAGLIAAVRALLEHDPERRPGAASLVLDLRAAGRPEPIDLRDMRHPEVSRRSGPSAGAEDRLGAAPASGGSVDPDTVGTADRAPAGRHQWPADEPESAGQESGSSAGGAGFLAPGRRAGRLAVPPGSDDAGRAVRARATTRARSDAVPMAAPTPVRRRRPALLPASFSGRAVRVGLIVLTCVLVTGLAAAAGLLWAGWDRSDPVAPAQASMAMASATSLTVSAGSSTATARAPATTPAAISAGRLPALLPTVPGVSSPPAARTPTARTSVTSRSTPGVRQLPGVTAIPGGPPNWAATVRVLDTARAKALVDRDVRLLDTVYTADSTARSADGVMIARLLSGGLRVSGAGHLIERAVVVGSSPIRLLVDDSLPSYSIIDARGVVVGRTTPRAIAAWVFVLVRTPAGYRISQVQSA